MEDELEWLRCSGWSRPAWVEARGWDTSYRGPESRKTISWSWRTTVFMSSSERFAGLVLVLTRPDCHG